MKTQLECIICLILFLLLATMLFLYSLEDFEGQKTNLNNSDMIVNSRYFRDEPKKSTEINFDVLFAGTSGYATVTPAPYVPTDSGTSDLSGVDNTGGTSMDNTGGQ